jgi:hypothetical protein
MTEPGLTRRRANLVACLLLAVLAVALGVVVAASGGPRPGVAPTPTPWLCAGGGR